VFWIGLYCALLWMLEYSVYLFLLAEKLQYVMGYESHVIEDDFDLTFTTEEK